MNEWPAIFSAEKKKNGTFALLLSSYAHFWRDSHFLDWCYSWFLVRFSIFLTVHQKTFYFLVQICTTLMTIFVSLFTISGWYYCLFLISFLADHIVCSPFPTPQIYIFYSHHHKDIVTIWYIESYRAYFWYFHAFWFEKVIFPFIGGIRVLTFRVHFWPFWFGKLNFRFLNQNSRFDRVKFWPSWVEKVTFRVLAKTRVLTPRVDILPYCVKEAKIEPTGQNSNFG